jgi:uncharacterized membrane protein YqjE
MRVLWLLPKAAPALLRHIGAYVELLALELEQSRRDLTINVLAALVAGVCVFFAVAMGCVVIVALTWDTPYRVAAVAWTGGVFVIGAVIALLYRSKVMKGQQRGPMTSENEVSGVAEQRKAVLARLAQSRAEIKRLLEPPADSAGTGTAHRGSGFPRSRTMRALLSGRGLGAVGATAAGLIMARPALAWRLIRMLPTGALLRVGIARVLDLIQGRHSSRP